MKILDIPALVAMANHNESAVMDDTMDPVRDLIAENDLVIAIWQDYSRPQGIGLMVVKGDNILRAAVTNHRAFEGKITAVRCIGAEQALALLIGAGGTAH